MKKLIPVSLVLLALGSSAYAIDFGFVLENCGIVMNDLANKRIVCGKESDVVDAAADVYRKNPTPENKNAIYAAQRVVLDCLSKADDACTDQFMKQDGK